MELSNPGKPRPQRKRAKKIASPPPKQIELQGGSQDRKVEVSRNDRDGIRSAQTFQGVLITMTENLLNVGTFLAVPSDKRREMLQTFMQEFDKNEGGESCGPKEMERFRKLFANLVELHHSIPSQDSYDLRGTRRNWQYLPEPSECWVCDVPIVSDASRVSLCVTCKSDIRPVSGGSDPTEDDEQQSNTTLDNTKAMVRQEQFEPATSATTPKEQSVVAHSPELMNEPNVESALEEETDEDFGDLVSHAVDEGAEMIQLVEPPTFEDDFDVEFEQPDAPKDLCPNLYMEIGQMSEDCSNIRVFLRHSPAYRSKVFQNCLKVYQKAKQNGKCPKNSEDLLAWLYEKLRTAHLQDVEHNVEDVEVPVEWRTPEHLTNLELPEGCTKLAAVIANMMKRIAGFQELVDSRRYDDLERYLAGYRAAKTQGKCTEIQERHFAWLFSRMLVKHQLAMPRQRFQFQRNPEHEEWARRSRPAGLSDLVVATPGQSDCGFCGLLMRSDEVVCPACDPTPAQLKARQDVEKSFISSMPSPDDVLRDFVVEAYEKRRKACNGMGELMRLYKTIADENLTYIIEGLRTILLDVTSTFMARHSQIRHAIIWGMIDRYHDLHSVGEVGEAADGTFKWLVVRVVFVHNNRCISDSRRFGPGLKYVVNLPQQEAWQTASQPHDIELAIPDSVLNPSCHLCEQSLSERQRPTGLCEKCCPSDVDEFDRCNRCIGEDLRCSTGKTCDDCEEIGLQASDCRGGGDDVALGKKRVRTSVTDPRPSKQSKRTRIEKQTPPAMGSNNIIAFNAPAVTQSPGDEVDQQPGPSEMFLPTSRTRREGVQPSFRGVAAQGSESVRDDSHHDVPDGSTSLREADNRARLTESVPGQPSDESVEALGDHYATADQEPEDHSLGMENEDSQRMRSLDVRGQQGTKRPGTDEYLDHLAKSRRVNPSIPTGGVESNANELWTIHQGTAPGQIDRRTTANSRDDSSNHGTTTSLSSNAQKLAPQGGGNVPSNTSAATSQSHPSGGQIRGTQAAPITIEDEPYQPTSATNQAEPALTQSDVLEQPPLGTYVSRDSYYYMPSVRDLVPFGDHIFPPLRNAVYAPPESLVTAPARPANCLVIPYQPPGYTWAPPAGVYGGQGYGMPNNGQANSHAAPQQMAPPQQIHAAQAHPAAPMAPNFNYTYVPGRGFVQQAPEVNNDQGRAMLPSSQRPSNFPNTEAVSMGSRAAREQNGNQNRQRASRRRNAQGMETAESEQTRQPSASSPLAQTTVEVSSTAISTSGHWPNTGSSNGAHDPESARSARK